MKLLFLVALLAPVGWSATAQIRLGRNTSVVFATVEAGQSVLTSRDEFVQNLSPFDRAARLKTDKDVSEEDYLKFVGQNVLAWTEADEQKVKSALQEIKTEFERMSLPLPRTVLLIQTTGQEEGEAAYTRSNAIVFPKHDLSKPAAELRRIVCHELFHVLSRANPDLREKSYAAIGFVKCNELPFPAELKARKITNPDAPRNDHCIRLRVSGQEHWAVPILYSKSEKYDPRRGGEFFEYLQFKLLLVERNDANVKPIYDGPMPKVEDLEDVSGFFEQVGKNTEYVLHPEEILADNFMLMVLHEKDVPSPEIIKKLEAILKERR